MKAELGNRPALRLQVIHRLVAGCAAGPAWKFSGAPAGEIVGIICSVPLQIIFIGIVIAAIENIVLSLLGQHQPPTVQFDSFVAIGALLVLKAIARDMGGGINPLIHTKISDLPMAVTVSAGP